MLLQNGLFLFCLGCLVPFSPLWEELHMNTVLSSPKQRDILHMHFHFPMGRYPSLPQKGGGGGGGDMCLKCPLDPPMYCKHCLGHITLTHGGINHIKHHCEGKGQSERIKFQLSSMTKFIDTASSFQTKKTGSGTF